MNKKVAILFNGLPRYFETPIQRWLEIKNQLNADIFIHTWDTDPDTTDKIIEKFQPKAHQIDRPEEFDVDKYKYLTPQNMSTYNILSSLTSKKRVFQLMEKYYTDNQQPLPDMLLISRFDLLVGELQCLDMDVLVIPMEPNKLPDCFHWQCQWMPSQSDVLAYGPVESIRVYCNLIDYVPRIFEIMNNWIFIPEWLLSINLWAHRIAYYSYVLDFKLIRS
jgi:hypothetical protein